MTVVPQTYTATATWTASQLADIFKQAFIDAGLMTDWFDSFTNTVENRILRVIYDAGKTYGTTYYWFMFTTGGVFTHTALSWNATTHVPSGTQYLDYFSTTTNATTNHQTLVSLASTTTTTITRYTSGINAGATWFVIRNGSTSRTFFIPTASYGPSAFVNLNFVAYNGMVAIFNSTSNNQTFFNIATAAGHTRRTFLGSASLRGELTGTEYAESITINRFIVAGNNNDIGSNISGSFGDGGTVLPTALVNTNSGLAADYTPVYTSPSISPYQAALPADFAFAPYYASNVMEVQDTFVVSSGTEEWEMMAVALNGTLANSAKIMFLARTVG